MAICAMLVARIMRLEQFGVMNLWMKKDGNDEFHAATLLGYSDERWEEIECYSGLWDSRGRMLPEKTWSKLLYGLTPKQIRYRPNYQMSTTMWFAF